MLKMNHQEQEYKSESDIYLPLRTPRPKPALIWQVYMTAHWLLQPL